MNGFLIYTGYSEKSLIPDRMNIPGHPEESLCRLTLADFASFVSWGNPPGDILCSENRNHSFLVLNGYIAEAPFIKQSLTKNDVANQLLEFLDIDHSIESCQNVADQIHGSFAFLYFNIKEKSAFCITDRIASRPMWVKNDGRAWIISSNANSIAYMNSNIEYDLGALGAFFLYGGPVEPAKSIYKGIKAIEPGTALSLKSGGVSKEYRWYQYKHNPDNKMSRSEWVDLASLRLRSSATRILNTVSKPLVFFSGGVDSRLTAAALRAVGGEPILATLGDHENLEIKVAKSAANALGCEHKIIIRDAHWYLRSLPNQVYETGGSFVSGHGHFSQAYRDLQSQLGVNAALLGDFCEAFSKLCFTLDKGRKRIWTSQEFLKEFDTLPLPLYRPANREFTLNLFKLRTRREIEESLENDILSRYNRLCDVSEDFRIVGDSFFRWHSAATIATFFMFLDVRSAGPERSLMFDKDLHHLIEILPGEMRDEANLGADLIKNLWPPAAKVVNANSLLPLSWPNRIHSAAKFMRPRLGKLHRFLFGNTYKTSSSFPEKSYLYLDDAKWHRLIEKLISNHSLFNDDIFEFKEIQNCWTTFCKGDLSMAGDLDKLVEIALSNLYRKQRLESFDHIFYTNHHNPIVKLIK